MHKLYYTGLITMGLLSQACATTEHDNVIYVKPYGFTVKQISFIEEAHAITPGQPYSGIFTNNKNKSITIKAGRHKENGTVAALQKYGIKTDHGVTDYFINENIGPEALNFGVKGRFIFSSDIGTYECPIALGQGSNYKALITKLNNWWVFPLEKQGFKSSGGAIHVTCHDMDTMNTEVFSFSIDKALLAAWWSLQIFNTK